jgi:hypothetical protein
VVHFCNMLTGASAGFSPAALRFGPTSNRALWR